MVDAVLLDWEEGLVRTSGSRREAFERALDDEGALARELGADPALADLVALRASRHFAERLGKGVVLEAGAREFIERVQSGARLAIVTRASRAETEFVLRLAGLDGAAAVIVAADDTLTNPFTTAIDHLERIRRVNPSRAIAIAHAPDLLAAAREAQLRVIAIGAPAHVAITADGSIDALDGVLLPDLARVAGLAALDRSA